MVDQLTATSIVDDKFWVVEKSGQKVGTILAVEEGGFAFVSQEHRKYFPSIRAIKKEYNITLVKSKKQKQSTASHEIYGYPCHAEPHGEVFNVKKHLPIYSLNDKSKSYYCAGYYRINYGSTWTVEFCPKLITLNRYRYVGPFTTHEQAQKEQL